MKNSNTPVRFAKSMEIKALRGFRDQYPAAMGPRREMFDRMRSVARRFNFQEMEGPALESLELFRVKSGPEIVDTTFSFTDKGGREVTLIPENTPTVARMFIYKQLELVQPVRWYSIERFWRYERPQEGRLREFYQGNFDILGDGSVSADAEMITMAADLIRAMGIESDTILKISHKDILRSLFASWGVDDPAPMFRAVDRLDKVGEDAVRQELAGLGLALERIQKLLQTVQVSGPITKTLPGLKGLLSAVDGLEETFERLERLGDLLEAAGVSDMCQLDLGIVRGLDYYTGTVFEAFDRKGELRALFGGGRYDNLIELFGGQPTPAVGFAIGDAVLEIAMKRSGSWPNWSGEPEFYLIALTDNEAAAAMALGTKLRSKGRSVEVDGSGAKPKKKFKRADRKNARFVLVFGEDEVREGKVSVKDLSTGKQVTVPQEKLLNSDPENLFDN